MKQPIQVFLYRRLPDGKAEELEWLWDKEITPRFGSKARAVLKTGRYNLVPGGTSWLQLEPYKEEK